MYRALNTSVEAILGFTLGYVTAGTIDFAFEFPVPARVTWNIVTSSPEVEEKMGKPFIRGFFWEGSVTDYQARCHFNILSLLFNILFCSITIPMYGPKGSAKAVSRLIKDDGGVWTPLLIVFRKDKTLLTLVKINQANLSMFHDGYTRWTQAASRDKELLLHARYLYICGSSASRSKYSRSIKLSMRFFKSEVFAGNFSCLKSSEISVV